MNLNRVYEKLRQQVERSGNEIDEVRLRRQAWVLRDRIIFEQSFSNSVASSSAAGAGGGRKFDSTKNNYVEDNYVEDYFE